MVDPADDWELANLEQQVNDLEYEVGEQHTLLTEARELLIEALKLDTDHPEWQYRVGAFLRRLPR